MAAQPQERVRKRLVWFSPLLLAVALTPAFLQTQYTCNRPTGDTRLSLLEVEVDGVSVIPFDPAVRVYDLTLQEETQATVRAVSMDPNARVTWYVPDGLGMLASGTLGVGGGEVTIDLPPDGYALYIGVYPPGGAINTYIVNINPACVPGSPCSDGNDCTADYCDPGTEQCVLTPVADGVACDFGGEIGTCFSGMCEMGFPCTEQGILDAIAFGGGPHYFTCDGPTTVVTQAEIVIDNDVILDGGGELTVDGNGSHRVFFVAGGVTAELIGFTMTGGSAGRGGGIYNDSGTLTLTNGTVSGNTADFSGGGGIWNSSGTLTLTNSTVSGNAAASSSGSGIWNSTGTLTMTNSTVSDNTSGGILNGDGTLTMTNSTVTGNTADNGAGIYNNGSLSTLTMTNSTVSGNTCNFSGGGIGNGGTLTMTNSAVSDNTSGAIGGGIFNLGTVTLTNSTVTGNTAADNGGGIRNGSLGTLTLTNSTVSDNTSGGIYSGGGIGNSGTLTLTNSTVSGNTAADNGGGIYNHGTATLTNSLIDDDCVGGGGGTISSGGGNVESPGNTCGFDQASDLVGVTAAELKLGPLADNGGPTKTYALLPGSVAIDMVDSSACVDADGAPLNADQRGVARPQGSQCDAGAFEWADCGGTPCDDGNECTADHCNPLDTSWCAYTTLADGTFCGVDGVCEAGACRERSWGTAELIETSDLYAGFYPAVAVDPNGDVTAVWSQTSGISSNRYTPGGGWSTAVTIGGDNTFDRNDTLDVTVDANGNATAVWGQSGGLWSNRYTPSGGWGTAVLISSGTSGRYHPRVVVDSAGNATAVWFQAIDSPEYSSHVWTNRYTLGQGWGTAVILDTSSTANVHEPDVAVDPNGNVTAIWSQWDGPSLNVWANRYTLSGGWGSPALIETEDLGGATGTHVAADLNGNVMAVWTQYDGSRYNVWGNRYTQSGGWGTAVVIQAGTNPYVAVDPDGAAMALGTSGGLWASRYTPSGGWGIAEAIETNSVEPHANVTFDPDGNATVVWTRQEGTKNVWSNRYTPTGGWGTAVLVETNDTGDAFGPRVAVDPNGNATVVWSQRDPGNWNWFNIWSNRFE